MAKISHVMGSLSSHVKIAVKKAKQYIAMDDNNQVMRNKAFQSRQRRNHEKILSESRVKAM